MSRLGIVRLVGTFALTLVLGASCGGEAESDLTLDDFVAGGGFESAEEAANREATFQRQTQENIASCMALEGFDYVPHLTTSGDPIIDLGLSQEEFAERYGFGLATGVREGGRPFAFAATNSSANPNTAIVDSMGTAERTAYFKALYGEDVALDPGTGALSDPVSAATLAGDTSCLQQAQEEASGSAEFWGEFATDWIDVVDRALADPRLVQARDAWTTCMAEQGYRFSDQQEMQAYLLRRLDEVVSYPNGKPSDLLFQPAVAASADLQPEFDDGALSALIDEEIAIATLSQECSAEHTEVFAEVLSEYEAQFVEENWDRLQEFRQDS